MKAQATIPKMSQTLPFLAIMTKLKKEKSYQKKRKNRRENLQLLKRLCSPTGLLAIFLED